MRQGMRKSFGDGGLEDKICIIIGIRLGIIK